MKKLLLPAWLFCISFFASAQSPQVWTSADMYQGIQKLNVLGSVLYIAAHPDDENTRLIAYLSKDRLYRTGYLSMTRGDGGQNLIGDEQGIELGLIRTQELLSARRIDGGEQFFTRAFDFGYSKNPEETFTKWDKEKILSDVVWVIRKFQPDVIITRFPTTGEGGHGHHTASAILANEAFAAAADPNRFPEQLKELKPWQVKRVLWNSFNFGGNAPANAIKLDVGGYNPLLGKSYGEIAAESRSQHKSQGFGVAAGRGEAFEYFTTTKGPAPSNDLMDDVDISWNKIKGGAAISQMINALLSSFDLSHPQRSVEGLIKLYQVINALEDGYWKTQKLKEIKELIAQCSGLFIDATSAVQFAVQTDSVRINFTINNRLGVEASLESISVDDFDSSFSQPLAGNRNVMVSRTFYIPREKPVTQPYWLQEDMQEGYYTITDASKVGQPDVDPAYIANIRLKIDGQSFTFSKPVKYRFTDPVRGELYEPLLVLPPLLVDVAPSHIIKTGKESTPFAVSLKAVKDFKSNDASLLIDNDPAPAYLQKHVSSIGKDRIVSDEFRIIDTLDMASRNVYLMNGNEKEIYSSGMQSIHYGHIPYINYYKPARLHVTSVDLKTYNKTIGYIVGAGDKVPDALEQMGYEVTLLSDKDLARNNLSRFDVIITGVRAYNTNEWMNKYYDKLMKYVSNGGNLIVQYNTSNNIGPIRAKMGPYDFNVSRTRVTDENAAVTFLKPQHLVLNFPNRITPADFKGWIQERSIYHASGFDTSKYETIFSMHDPGESADPGSLIIAKYGKGYFTYTGLVFFRELPAGVPGAYRLLANLIALNRKKAF